MASPLRKPKFQPLQLSAVWILPVGGGAFLRRWANFRDGDHSNSGGKTVAAAITVAAMRSFRVQGSTLLEEHYRWFRFWPMLPAMLPCVFFIHGCLGEKFLKEIETWSC